MGYAHIENLYRRDAQDVLLFKEVYAMEKVHGTSANVPWRDGHLTFFAGGESHANFVALFDKAALTAAFQEMKQDPVVIHGEAYGGKQQGMSATYGKQLAFIAFDVHIGDKWLSVPDAEQVVQSLGLEFVPYDKVPTDLDVLDAHRDSFSVVAERRGCGTDKLREGDVLRPLVEVTKNNGERICAKHKGAAFSERVHTPRVQETSEGKLQVLAEASAIAQEWVTPMRLAHVLDKLPQATGMEAVPVVIAAMKEDVTREGEGELVPSKEALAAIGKRTAVLFKEWLQGRLREAA